MVTVLQVIALLAFAWCIVFCLRHFLRLVKLGKVKDLSQKSGNVAKAVVYSNTAAMLPNKKESAYKHLPTYTAGIIFHLGSFLSLLLFVPLFSTKTWLWFSLHWWLVVCMACLLLMSSSCGFFLFFKRLFSKKLRPISNFDDYFSESIVTLFQLFSFALLLPFVTELFADIIIEEVTSNYFDFTLYGILPNEYFTLATVYGYYITASLLFLYLPFGKLKHVVYFFAARYHLGFFYGWRNSWPPSKK